MNHKKLIRHFLFIKAVKIILISFIFIPDLSADTKIDKDKKTITIRDNGIGMTDENLKKLGNDGFQIKPENQAGGGSGYGIGIIKRHIKNLNGNLTISSELNKGTTFIVTFP